MNPKLVIDLCGEDVQVVGRSYQVRCDARDLAPYMARIAAAAEGQRNARTAEVLWTERIETGVYEVVLAEPAARA